VSASESARGTVTPDAAESQRAASRDADNGGLGPVGDAAVSVLRKQWAEEAERELTSRRNGLLFTGPDLYGRGMCAGLNFAIDIVRDLGVSL
jgi:hypothetical protein